MRRFVIGDQRGGMKMKRIIALLVLIVVLIGCSNQTLNEEQIIDLSREVLECKNAYNTLYNDREYWYNNSKMLVDERNYWYNATIRWQNSTNNWIDLYDRCKASRDYWIDECDERVEECRDFYNEEMDDTFDWCDKRVEDWKDFYEGLLYECYEGY